MGKILVVIIKERNYGSKRIDFKNNYNLEDSNQILLLLELLESAFNAPIKKAIDKYLNKQQKVFPI